LSAPVQRRSYDPVDAIEHECPATGREPVLSHVIRHAEVREVLRAEDAVVQLGDVTDQDVDISHAL
jgi:hypothetical protein